mmetsp:Transcript_10610/g.32457  ORF Transcript_10610/g.32457 Transcript_10610/m.32457 type:complete len:302 (-) Transcript_10610:709-1614(-)
MTVALGGSAGFVSVGNCVGRRRREGLLRAQVPNSVRRHVQRWGGNAGGAVALNRILFTDDEVGQDGVVSLGADDVRSWHVRNVLKVENGGQIRAGVVDEGLYDEASVRLCAEGGISVRLGEGKVVQSRPRVDVLLALPRPGVMGRLWPTLATLGVGNIVVVSAYRVEKCYFNAKIMREEEIRSGLIEGLMQAGCDCMLPQVLIRKRLKHFLEDEIDGLSPHGSLRVVGHPNIQSKRMASLPMEGPESRIMVAVGPEGGWMDRELEMLERYQFHGVSLGPRALRTDVACSALVVLANDKLAA